jgi:hypothetical protein
MQPQTRNRLATVVIAPLAALATWGVVRLLGVDLVVSRGGSSSTVGAADVIGAALVASLLGWWVVRQIERRSANPRRVWARVSSTALAVSMIGPTWFADGTTSLALISLHVATAVVVIVGMVRTLPGCPVRQPPTRFSTAGR